jgi:hypothetical protein
MEVAFSRKEVPTAADNMDFISLMTDKAIPLLLLHLCSVLMDHVCWPAAAERRGYHRTVILPAYAVVFNRPQYTYVI